MLNLYKYEPQFNTFKIERSLWAQQDSGFEERKKTFENKMEFDNSYISFFHYPIFPLY